MEVSGAHPAAGVEFILDIVNPVPWTNWKGCMVRRIHWTFRKVLEGGGKRSPSHTWGVSMSPFLVSPAPQLLGSLIPPHCDVLLQAGGGSLVEGTAKLGKQILGLERRVLDPVQVGVVEGEKPKVCHSPHPPIAITLNHSYPPFAHTFRQPRPPTRQQTR